MKYQSCLCVYPGLDAWKQWIWIFILTTIHNILMQITHPKSFEMPKLAFGNISDFHAWLQKIWLSKSAKELDLLVQSLHLKQLFRCMQAANMILHSLTILESTSAKFTCNIILVAKTCLWNNSILMHDCNRYDFSNLLKNWIR